MPNRGRPARRDCRVAGGKQPEYGKRRVSNARMRATGHERDGISPCPRFRAMFVPSLIDFAGHRMVLTDTAGQQQELPLPDDAFGGLASAFDAVGIDLDADELVLHLPEEAGELVAEIGLHDPEDLGSRPVVYLDQNHWSTLAAVRFRLRDIDGKTADAARRLLQLAADRRIILPLSAGHAIETSRQYNDRRVALAATMLEGSRGWQMRHPVRVRGVELGAALGDGRLVATEGATFTRAPDVLWTRRLHPGPQLPIPPFDRLFPRLTDMASFAATLRDPDALPDERGAADAWNQQWQRLGGLLEGEAAGAERTAEVTMGAVLADLAEELLAHAPVDEVATWFERSGRDDVGGMPYLSRLVRVTFARLRNRGGRWDVNDYVDLNFLCCAAGYADVVIGERRTIADLRAATNCPAGARLANRLIDGVQVVEHILGDP